MKTIGEALAETMALFAPLASEELSLGDALGRFTAAPLVAAVEVPAFDASLVDGYAVRASDVASRTLPVIGESRAGAELPSALVFGTAMRIFTGAPIPLGADTVVMQEIVRRDGASAHFERDVNVGAAIRRRASDIAIGDELLAAGALVDAGAIGLAASQGRDRITVHRAARVAIVTTGDELLSPGELRRPGALYDSNGPVISALVRSAGGIVTSVTRARDELDETVRMLAAAIASADVVITAGGVSVGDHDLVHAALAQLGVTRTLWKVRMKPGKPLAVGVKDGVPVLGLPGNPVSAWVGFEVFVRPGLRRMIGDPRPHRRARNVRLGAAVRCSPDRPELARARLDEHDLAWPSVNQGSSALGSTTSVDVLLVLPEREGELPAGETVRALVLSGSGRDHASF